MTLGRVLVLLLLAALSWGGMGRAEAQVKTCDNISAGCSLPEAYGWAVSKAQESWRFCSVDSAQVNEGAGTVTVVWSGVRFTGQGCESGYGQSTGFFSTGCPAGTQWDDTGKMCRQDCATAQPYTSGVTVPNGSIECRNGCDYVNFYNGDGTFTGLPVGTQCPFDLTEREAQCNAMAGHYWTTSPFPMCAPIEPEDCPEGVDPKEGVCKRPDSCPDGLTVGPDGWCIPKTEDCPIGSTKGPDGSCTKSACPTGSAHGKDGTCKLDKDGDGVPDEEQDSDGDGEPDGPGEKNEFSGGDTCDAPPVCSGDPIMCGQARIQWRIECNTRNDVTISGGACDTPPSCTGKNCNAMEAAQLLQQWRTSCALQTLSSGEGDTGGQPEWTRVDGMTQDPGEGASEGDTNVWAEETTIDGSTLDTGGWLGGGGSCPSFGFAVTGGEYSSAFVEKIANPPAFWCEMVSWIYAMILVFSTVTGIFILAGRGNA